MAHIFTREYWDISGSGNSKAVRAWERKFKVVFDEIVDIPDALDAPGIPLRWEAHPADFRMLAHDADASHWQGDPFTWIVTVQYSSLAGDEERGADDPRDRPTEIETDFIAYQIPMLYDKDNTAVLNSAGDPHDPSWQMEDSRPVIRFRRFETDRDIQRSLDYRNAVNTDTFDIFAPGELMCMYIKQKRHFENAIECWDTAYEFQGKANGQVLHRGVLTDYKGWDAVIPDVGFNKITGSGRELIRDTSGKPVSSPVRLNGFGGELAFDAPFDETAFGIFRPPYRYRSFAALGLP